MITASFQHYLDLLHQRFASLDGGAVADYIPELGKADPDWFGIAVVTVDGHVYQSGDTRQPFSIQSISKAFTYGIALEDKGAETVASKIDVEPSGEAFNSISLEPDTGRPRNPMINAGAIVATSLVDSTDGNDRLSRILDKFARYSGRPLSVDDAIYQSEKNTGHRNRAIAHLLRNYNILEDDPEEPLDAYFRQCSILVMELTGELVFVPAEIVAATAIEQMEARDFIIIDLARVTSVDQSACTLLGELAEELGNQGKKVLITGAERHYHLIRFLKRHFGSSGNMPVLDYPDVDHALEYAEDSLLDESQVDTGGITRLPIEEQPLCSNLDADELELLRSLLQEESYQAGELICREGQPADRLFFLSSGRVSVSLDLDHKHQHRLSASTAGWAFGESALFSGHNRTADIRADTGVNLYSLDPDRLREMDHPTATRVLIKLLTNLSELSLMRLERANREIRILTC